MDNNWLQYAPASNKLKQTYVSGFMDISGNVIIRGTGGLKIAGGNVIGITKSMVGLANVDNTADANKPISTAQQTALDLKAPLASPTFTGLVTIPATSVTNTTDSTSTTTGALLVAGGVGIGGSVNIGGNTRIIGGLTVDGSLNVTGNIIRTDVQSKVYISEQVDVSNSGTGPGLIVRQFGAQDIAAFYDDAVQVVTIRDGGDVSMNHKLNVGGIVSIQNATVSTSTTTGALQVSGGIGIGGNLYIGGITVGITQSMVGLANVNDTTDAAKPVSTAQQTALDFKAPLASPTFTGTVSGITQSMVGLGSVDNTTDANKPVSTAQQTALDFKAPKESPTFTGTVTVPATLITNTTDSSSTTSGALQVVGGAGIGGNLYVGGTTFGITQSMVGLGNVDNTTDTDKPVSTTQQTALDLKSNLASPTFTGTVTTPIVSVTGTAISTTTGTGALVVTGGVGIGGNLVIGGTAIGITQSMVGLANVDNTTDANKPISTAQQTALDLKSNLASPTFTGTVGGITQSMVGLGNVDNTTDANKPVSTAQQTALDLKSNLASPTFTGTVGGITQSMIGLGNVDNTTDANKPVSTTQQTALDLKSNLASPTFTGTVGGITQSMVGLGNVDNTTDTNKPVSTAQQTALDLKSNLASPTFTGTVGGITKSMVGLGNVNDTTDANKPVSTAQQTALDLKSNLASPTFTGTVTTPVVSVTGTAISTTTGTGALVVTGGVGIGGNLIIGGTAIGITQSMVGLGNVDNTTDANKPVSTTQQTALDLKSNLASPTFTGTVGGITQSMVGLGNVDNTTDANKPVSTAQQTALDLKSNLASPSFTGTILASSTTISTSHETGALVVNGGVGIGGNLYVNGTTVGVTKSMVGLSNVDNTTDTNKPISTAQQTALDLKATLASPTFTGIVTVPTMSITSTTTSTSTHTGALVVAGGSGIGGNLYVGGGARIVGGLTVDGSFNVTGSVIRTDIQSTIYISEQVDISNSGSGPGLKVRQSGTQSIAEFYDDVLLVVAIKDGGDVSMNSSLYIGKQTHATGQVLITDTTVSTTISSGALVVGGGAGIGGNLYVGGNMNIAGSVTGITKSSIGLSNVDNTSDMAKPVSTAQQTEIDLKANLLSPTFTGTVSGITKSMVGLGNADNTSDTNKPISTAQQTAIDLKANLASPTFTGTVVGITKSMIGLTNADNTADTAKPVSTAQQTAIDLKANLASPTFTGTVSGITKSMVGLGSVDNTTDTAKPVSTAQQTAIDLKANLASPTFTGAVTMPATSITNATVSTSTTTGALVVSGGVGIGGNLYVNGTVVGITKSMVDLGNVNNTSDASKPVSTAQQTALNLKADLASPTFTGTVVGITKSMVGLGNVNDTADTAKPVSTAQQTALDLKANLLSPTFTGTVVGITKSMVGLGSVDNTADTAKPVSTAQQTALDLKANLASPTFTGTVGGITKSMVGLGSVDNTTDTAKPVSTAQQTAIDLKANLASPTFTGAVTMPATSVTNATVSTSTTTGALVVSGGVGIGGNLYVNGTVVGITKSMVGLGSVDNTADTAKPVSTAQQTALNLKADLASPTFTGTVVGITKSMVGLGSVDNTADTAKPVSTAQQTALDLKAPLASPTFTGTITTPATSITSTTNSTSTGSGALQVTGGVGIGGNVFIGGNTRIYGGLTVDGSFNVTGSIISTTLKETIRMSERVDISNSGTGPGLTVRQYGAAAIAEFYDDNVSIMQIKDGGDVSMNKQLFVGGISFMKNTTVATSTASGALQVSGGAGIGGNVFIGGNTVVGGNLIVSGTTANLPASCITSTNIVDGTIVDGDINASAAIAQSKISGLTTDLSNRIDTTTSQSITAGTKTFATGTTLAVASGATLSVAGTQTISNSTASTSTATGALVVSGGAGIGGSVYVGGNIIMTNANNNSTRFGYLALNSNTGSSNTGFGTSALTTNSGNNNTAVGASALTANTGSSNTGVGNSAGASISTGINNTVIGASAGGANLTISGNVTLIGANTSISVGNWVGSTAIGYNSQIKASNQIVLGTVTEFVSIPGTAVSTSQTTGALVVSGGSGIGGNVYVGGIIFAAGGKYIPQFIAANSTPSSVISSDGINWNSITAFGTAGQSINSIVYGGSNWVAGLSNGNIYTSPDGVTWTLRTSNLTACNEVAWNGTYWLAAGRAASVTAIVKSIDGGNAWSAPISNILLGNSGDTTIYGLVWNPVTSIWVAGTYTGAGLPSIVSSPDAVTWTSLSTTVSVAGKLRTNGTRYIVCANGLYTRNSNDAITWTSSANLTGTSGSVGDAAWNGSIWMAITTGATTPGSYTSSDGAIWTRTAGTLPIGRSITWNSPYWVVGASDGIYYSSDNGATWTLGTGSITSARVGSSLVINKASTNVSSGALQVTGGAGIVGNVFIGGNTVVGGNLIVSGTTVTLPASCITATNIADSAITGVKISGTTITGNKIVNNTITATQMATDIVITTTGMINSTNTTNSTSTTTGALQVVGGAGIGGTVYIGGNLIVLGTVIDTGVRGSATISDGSIYGNMIALTTINGNNLASGIVISTSGTIASTNSTPSTSNSTGALVIAGGAGIGGNVYVGGTIFAVSTITYGLTVSTGGGGFYTSIDGVTWINRPAPSSIGSAIPSKVVWGGSNWTICTGSTALTNTISTSPDGITWTGRGNAVVTKCYDIASNGSYWLAAGAVTGGNGIAGSGDDGATWTVVANTNLVVTSNEARSVTWNSQKSLWVVTGTGSSSVSTVVTSSNGTTWTVATTATTGFTSVYNNGNMFIGTNYSAARYSSDGKTWTTITPIIGGSIYTMKWNGSLWMAVTDLSPYTYTSANGINWTGTSSIAGSGPYSVTWNGTYWIAGGSNTAYYSSNNGASWTAGSGGTQLHGVGTKITSAGGNAVVDNLVVNGTTTFAAGTITGAKIALGTITGDLLASTLTTSGTIASTNSTASTNTSTGALVVSGGAGIVGNVFIGGNIIMTNVNNNSTRFGYLALNANVGSNNTGFGASALTANSGNNNTAIGTSAIALNTGSDNTSVGYNSISFSGSGVQNTAVGSFALYKVTGSGNSGFGISSGLSITTGQYNTCIGGYADATLISATYSTAIGFNSRITASNQIVLGTATEFVSIPGTTVSTSISTGALVIAGGVGIKGDTYIGSSGGYGLSVGVVYSNSGIITSADGITWTARTTGLTGTSGDGASAVWGGSNWVVSNGAASTNTIATSPDGITWTGRGNSVVNKAAGIAWNGTYWLVVGSIVGVIGIARSNDGGATWTAVANTKLTAYDNTVSNGGCITWSSTLSLWVAAAWNNVSLASNIVSSPDGITWTTATTSNNGFMKIENNGNMFIGTLNGNTGYYSYDGKIWNTMDVGILTKGLKWNGSIWMAGGYNGTSTIFKSTNGITWSAATAPAAGASYVRSLSWNGTYWMAGVDNNIYYSSNNGTSWTLGSSGVTAGDLIMGIGTKATYATPSTSTTTGALVVSGGTGIAGNLNVGGAALFTDTTASSTTQSGALQVRGGAGFGKAIYAPAFTVSSDSRIKKNITDMSGQSSLESLRNLKPSEYSLINNPEQSKVYGLIAQEVKQNIPEAVSIGTDFVPSIYEMAFINDDKTIVTLINKTTDVSWNRIKISDEPYDVADIIDYKTFRIKTEIPKEKIELVDVSGAKLTLNQGVYRYKDTNEIYTGIVNNGVFVYGPEVPDFHSLNKDVIWTVTTRATQELDRQLQEARQTIRNQDVCILKLEQEIALIKEHLHM